MILEHQQEVREKEFALCLNMIVKNESHIIKDTLTKLLQKVKFDYWVISDTGSTDETIEIITEFFKEVGIPGELYKNDWVDFAYNRNRALEYAFGKSKYLLVFDADDEIVGDFVLPELTKDYYILHFGTYTRTQIVNNHKRWKYIGVLHECICSDDSTIDVESMDIIIGRYHIKSGRTGNRNLDANKYLKDAILLEKAYNDAVNAKNDIYNRYGFYCANSYYDCGKYESAISWYKKTLENGGWAQEKYVSCLNLYRCYEKLDNKEAGFFYLVKSAEYDRERSECYYELIKHYSSSGLHDVAYGYYSSVLRDFYKNSYLKTGLNNKLFLDVNIPDFYLPYYVAIVCEKMCDYETGIHMYRIIFTKKCKIFDTWFVGNLIYNLQFFIEHVKEEDKTAFYSLFQEYVDFLIANNYPMCKHYDLIQKYKKYGIVTYVISEECSTSTKILIYTGFQNKSWNYTEISSMGGSEKAVAYLAKNLPKEYEIIISGDVEDEVVGNVTYVNRFKLQAVLDVEKFHTIIVSRYISFFILFPHFKCYQLYLSAHDNAFLNNFDDISPNCLIEENNKYINGVICLTTWHKLFMIKKYPCLKDKVKVINNGVLLSDCDATSLSYNKVKNKFVWTSCSYRGLDVLLKLWDKILEVMPDATLDISSYLPFPNPNNIVMDEEILLIINRHSESVKHHGILNTAEVYNLMSRAEYFLYTSTFCETSCITALEMLMHEVVCLYYPLAGLNDTIGEYGIKVNYGQEIESIMNLSEERKAEMKINGKKYAMSCSWENRAKEWVSVLGLNSRCVVNAQVTSVEDDSVDDDIYNMNKIHDSINLMFKYGISNNTDKVVHHEYHKFYDNILQPFHKSYGGLVEIGLGYGASLPMWMSMFENSHIYGIEKEISNTSISNDKVTILEADQSNIDDLKKIKSMLMNKNIFFINDDGSHIPEHQISTFNMLFPILVEGGIYIIEDIETSYWTKGSCYDYKTEYGYKHSKSIIEIFKDSIDIINREFISDKKQLSNKILHHNYIESVLFARNCIIIKKTYNADREYRFKQFIEVETTSKDINAEVKINSNKKEWAFFCSTFFEKQMIQQYIDNLNLNNLYPDYYICVTSDKEAIMKSKPEKVTIVYEVFDSSIFNALPNSKFSFLNTEPLTIPYRLDNVKLIFDLYKKHVDSFNYYDYSESNLRLLNEKCIGVGVDKVYLPYKCSSEELSTLHNLNKNTKKEYDFGILKTLGKEVSSRRNKIVDFLKSYNFSINIIEGWNYNDRDFELAKCKIILNIHGNLNNDVSTIFEHIRCDRLLEAGFNILSETCYDLSLEFIQKYPNLKLIEYEEFFDVGIIVDCYNNSFVSNEHNKYVLEMLNNHYNRFDMPFSHVSFIEKLSLEFNPKRMVIYDIGSNVLHWSQHAKVLWKDSSIYAFDAMTEMKLLYDEYNKKNNTTFEYNVGVLCDEDYKRISFYQNDEYSTGNSYYKEIGHCNSHNAYTENHIKHKIGMKLETVVKNKKIPLPDLIKIDVQGAELDILKGSMKIINNAKFLIVELQHVEYNQGAPLCNKTRDFLIENGWEVYAEKFSNNGPDADWCFINKNNHYFELHPSNDDTKNITNLTCITCNEMCDMCDMFQINDTLTGVDNITFYYGVGNKHIDITNVVFEKCITDNKIVIPGGDEERGFIFGDPVFGIVKNIYMVVNNCKYCKITYDYYTCIDIFNKKCHISNSINPSALTVYKPPFEKMRLGRNNDGGYVICDIQNINYNLLLSCGISDDISFEESFCNKYNTTACYAFDGTIENINISNKNISFFRQNINNYNDDKNTNLHSTIEMFDNIFLKMDIEGYEIPWINSLNVKQLNKFSQIVIEFHFPFSYKEVHAFDILNETHILVHFHGNNCCGVRNHKGVNIPNVFECTYVHKRHYSPPYIFNTDVIPGVLDMNNLSNINEIIIDYEPFVFKYNKKNKMIVDCFIFYNELDMLNYRLNILDKVVDYFVLVESTHTHVGKEKPLFYNENKHLFAKFNHKIIHIVVDDFPHKYPNINIEKQEQWINERFQRDCISRGIDKLNLAGEDIIIISDLDEIPNPTVLENVKNNNIVVGINILDMDIYYYNLNSKMGIKWYAGKILTFEKYNELNIDCDKLRFYNCPIINNGGWHLSFFGNEKFIKNKLENFTHQEFNITEFTDEKRIEERIKNGKDLFDRGCCLIENIRIEDNNNLPPDYDIYLKNYYESNHLSEDGKEEVKINSNKNEMDLNKFNNGKSKFNILNLILFSNKNSSAAPVDSQISTLALQEYYSKMIQLQKEYIKSYSGNNITFYFYCYKEDLEEEYIIEDNMIYIKGTETYIPGILEKTMKVFEITKNMEYDFLLRSNISTIVDYSKLNEILYEIPDNVTYAGGSCLLHNRIDEKSGIHKIYNIPFILGTSIILKKEGVNKLIENKKLLHETIVDDFAIGIFFNYFGDKPHGFDSYYCYNLHCMTNDVVFYRNRISYGTEDIDRNTEFNNMTNITKQIIERDREQQ
jgi:beta-1,4-mannosyl-glycoprotein beta-1,4-N-acetylglucosaminyltransferase